MFTGSYRKGRDRGPGMGAVQEHIASLAEFDAQAGESRGGLVGGGRGETVEGGSVRMIFPGNQIFRRGQSPVPKIGGIFQ